MTQLAEHLGGYTPGGDPATFFPDLWAWLVEELGVRSVIDVGCGEGHALAEFRGLGCEVLGVDGVPQEDPDVVVHDYTTGPLMLKTKFDLCWSCEFVEHVEERYVPNFLLSFGMADLVLITHATPGQLGHHHVNCRPAEYWAGAMAAIGYRLEHHLTDITRSLARKNTSPWNHYLRSGMAFRRFD